MVDQLKTNDAGFYIINSTTDDWITDHAGDPGEADFDTPLTEGTDYIVLKNIYSVRRQQTYGHKNVSLGLGISSDYSIGKDKKIISIVASVTRAYTSTIDVFCDRQNRAASSKIYLVYHLGSDAFHSFYDNAHAAKTYIPCVPVSCDKVWIAGKPSRWKVTLTLILFWRSAD